MNEKKVIEKINLLIDDLNKSSQQRLKGRPPFFSEELLIIRLKEILKEVESND